MVKIEVSEEEFEALKRVAMPLMKPDDTVNDGIRKWIRMQLGLDVKDRTIEGVLECIPEGVYRELAEDILNELKNRMDVKYTLPSKEAWARGDRWITIKKTNPRGKREVIGWLGPRKYGFILYVFDPIKGDYTEFKIGKDLTCITAKELGEGAFTFEKDESAYEEIKSKIIEAFQRAYEST